MRTIYDKTYYVKCQIGDKIETKFTTKSFKVAQEKANGFLATLLYDDVTIDCLTIKY